MTGCIFQAQSAGAGDSPDRLEGEIVVSAETAQKNAPEFGWSPEEELCLYVVHGALHLAGYRDKTASEERAMRQAEQETLADIGIQVRNFDK